MLLVIMIPLRVTLSRRRYHEPSHVNRFDMTVVIIHMILCLGWMMYALYNLSNSDRSCWDPFTWQYLNYFLILLITLGPAITLALAIALVIVSLPCIVRELCTGVLD